MSMKKRDDPKYIQAFERGMLRSAFLSLFWGVFTERKKRDGLTLKALAKAVGVNKAEVSRWFNGDPNWTINTIANLANALDVEILVEARERSTGKIFTPNGPVQVENPLKQRTETVQVYMPPTSKGFLPPTSNTSNFSMNDLQAAA